MSFRCGMVLAALLASSTVLAQGAPAATGTNAAVKATVADPLPGNAATGQTKAAVCGACHGMDGNSTDPQYPKLAGQNEAYIVRQLHNFKSGQRQNPIMLGFASQLSDQDMYDLGAYFMSKQSRPGVADEHLVKAGEKLYREGDASRGIPACMACHGPDGRGNPGAGYPQLAGQHAQYLQSVLTAWHDGTPWGKDAHAKIMLTIAERLSPDDITAVSSYLEGLHTQDVGNTANGAAP